MRQGITALLFAFLLSLPSMHVFAEDSPIKTTTTASVSDIDQLLSDKNTELVNAQKKLKEHQQAVAQNKSELAQLRKQALKLDQNLHKTKVKLESAYKKMITDPKLDITKFQKDYQSAWSTYKQNQKSRYRLENQLETQKGTLQDQQTTVSLIQKNILNLQQNKLKARAKRLSTELTQEGQQKVSFTNRCHPSMTIEQCKQQTIELALQKAVKKFQSSLLSSATESQYISKYANRASLNIHVLQHQVIKTGFSDASRYRTIVEATLEARPSETAACRLLHIGEQYCISNTDSDQQQEVAWFNLTVHSNLYNDRVFVDGVQYGKTPLTLTLPEGKHLIRVEKSGYIPYRLAFNLHKDQGIRAVLKEKSNQLKTGFRFADALSAKVTGPELITITPGKFFIGEHASSQVILDHAFAISSTPITVATFKLFVEQTGYKTDAELTKTCTAMIKNQMTPLNGRYWRNPGFKQSQQDPVVCVSLNDAKIFTKWLSKKTKYTYRLPTEDEWEIAARAGQQTDYWWGNNFEAGRANTGWGGTNWSNQSTSPVKSFPPSPLGLYDVVGNVWEWTANPQGLAKGGAWSFSPISAKAYKRLFTAPSTAANYIGFRVVREIK
jgi:formylglycine-generating enzyme required for sulfatase activity